MTYQRLPYDDAATTTEMAGDCAEVGRALHIPEQPVALGVPMEARQHHLGTVEVSDRLAALAADLELHFD